MTSCAWEERRRREEAEKAKIEALLRRHYGLESESCGSRGTPTEVRTMLAKACKDPFVGILFALVMFFTLKLCNLTLLCFISYVLMCY